VSTILFGGEVSHSVLKSYTTSDFRTYTYSWYKLSLLEEQRLEDLCAKLEAKLGHDIVYMRVDQISYFGDLYVVELEMRTCRLWLEGDDRGTAAARLVRAVQRYYVHRSGHAVEKFKRPLSSLYQRGGSLVHSRNMKGSPCSPMEYFSVCHSGSYWVLHVPAPGGLNILSGDMDTIICPRVLPFGSGCFVIRQYGSQDAHENGLIGCVSFISADGAKCSISSVHRFGLVAPCADSEQCELLLDNARPGDALRMCLRSLVVTAPLRVVGRLVELQRDTLSLKGLIIREVPWPSRDLDHDMYELAVPPGCYVEAGDIVALYPLYISSGSPYSNYKSVPGQYSVNVRDIRDGQPHVQGCTALSMPSTLRACRRMHQFRPSALHHACYANCDLPHNNCEMHQLHVGLGPDSFEEKYKTDGGLDGVSVVNEEGIVCALVANERIEGGSDGCPVCWDYQWPDKPWATSTAAKKRRIDDSHASLKYEGMQERLWEQLGATGLLPKDALLAHTMPDR